MRRNSVVSFKGDQTYVMYGRVIRMLPGDRAEVIDGGAHVTVYNVYDLDLHDDYKGRWDYRRNHKWKIGDSPDDEYIGFFRPMTSLRKLKQKRAYYDNTIWKHRRKKLTLLDYLKMEY